MTKKSHNKKRNVGIIYEQLLVAIASGLVENDVTKEKNAKIIIKRFFRKDTELYKEHRLFKALIEPHIPDGSLATKILDEAKKAARKHNSHKLNREKSRLIREINHTFGKDFYKQKIPDYTIFATVQTLLNDWRSYGDADISRVALYESKVHKVLTEEKLTENLENNKNEEVDSLVVKVMTEKYNNKYGKALTDVQQLLVKEYIFAENGDTNKFQRLLSQIKETVVRDLELYTADCDNQHVANKINEVKKDIRSLNINTLDDNTMTRFLTLCDLSEELRRQ